MGSSRRHLGAEGKGGASDVSGCGMGRLARHDSVPLCQGRAPLQDLGKGEVSEWLKKRKDDTKGATEGQKNT